MQRPASTLTLLSPLNPKVYLASADGGDPMLLISGEFRPVDPTWSPDGNSIASGGSMQSGAATEIRILSLATKETHTIPVSLVMFAPRRSPDGRYIAAQSENSKKLFLYSLKKNHWTELLVPHLSTYDKIGWPAWSHDSRYLYAMAETKIYSFSVPGGEPEPVAGVNDWDFLCPAFPASGGQEQRNFGPIGPSYGSIIRAWQPCDMASKNLEMYRTFALSSTPSLRWHGPRVQTALQTSSISAGLTIRGCLQSRL